MILEMQQLMGLCESPGVCGVADACVSQASAWFALAPSSKLW